MSQNYNGDLNKEIRSWLLKVFAYADSLSQTKLIVRDCPVCGSSQNEFSMNNGSLNYVRCSDCSLLFMNPAPDPASINSGFKGDDEIVTEYLQIMIKYRKRVSEKPDPVVDNKLRDIYSIKRTGRLLDIGCSFGDFLAKASHFYDVSGVEVNPVTANIAAQDFPVYRGFLQDLNLVQEYDIATLHQVLYGVPDPVGLFSAIRRILKDDGILYVNTPNSDSYAMRCYQGKANHVYGYTTQNVFNRQSLAVLGKKTGFKIRSFRTEWLDIYTTDLLVYLESPDDFIHKKNTQVPGYESLIHCEDGFHQSLGFNLGDRGNYLVAVLEKT